ncbi:Prolyl 3-hydroxylase OGFOD1 [Chionoecetes opilio]|uniref:uS12 prolyl 3-hydroxylase n=1 Tax=Chionoecetes opilio TaxID=41210 RepID=A0A8J4YBL6_CHIOP|nr:Prolyl 3-hydroxylase OGFOD1 [Chionoecetes opilio]
MKETNTVEQTMKKENETQHGESTAPHSLANGNSHTAAFRGEEQKGLKVDKTEVGAQGRGQEEEEEEEEEKVQNTNNTVTPSETHNPNATTPNEPQQLGKRTIDQIDHIDHSSVSVDSKESQGRADEETVPAKRLKMDAPNCVPDPQKNGTDVEKKSPKKKKKRQRKKKKPSGASGQVDNVSGVNMNDGNDKGEANKIKKEMPSDTPVTDGTAGNEKPKKKRKRKPKRKRNQVDNSSVTKEEEEKEEEEMPAKKIKTETPNTALASQQKGTTQEAAATLTPAQKKRMRKKQRKVEEKEKLNSQLTTETPNPSASSCDDVQSKAETSQPPQPLLDNKPSTLHPPILHHSCTSVANKKELTSCWTTNTKEGVVLQEGAIEVLKSPFTCCYLANLLEDKDFLEGVKRELEGVELLDKNNDLYKASVISVFPADGRPEGRHHALHLRSEAPTLHGGRQWLMEVTKIPLNDTVDMGSSRYNHTDVLLCHDDELEGRRIAYILYLVPPWHKEDGGCLDLFNTDDDGHPKEVVRSLIPKNNAFAFFEVSPKSFHQVSEVLCSDKTRISINGWFHGPPIPRPQRKQPAIPPRTPPGAFEEVDFYTWINPMYLDTEMQKEIRKKFCSESELQLENFLTEEAYEKLCLALRGKDVAWEYTGPANMQHYEVLAPDNVPQEIKECQQFMGCEAFFLVLSQLTGLKLHSMAPQDEEDEEEPGTAVSNPLCRVEAQRWSHGCHTLIRDDCVEQRAALDAYLYTGVSEAWQQDMGGHVTYITRDEDEELLTVIPRSNCLSLVYRDAQTLRFTKYINASSLALGLLDSSYHTFAGVYQE